LPAATVLLPLHLLAWLTLLAIILVMVLGAMAMAPSRAVRHSARNRT
jgi:hypothetical protein